MALIEAIHTRDPFILSELMRINSMHPLGVPVTPGKPLRASCEDRRCLHLMLLVFGGAQFINDKRSHCSAIEPAVVLRVSDNFVFINNDPPSRSCYTRSAE